MKPVEEIDWIRSRGHRERSTRVDSEAVQASRMIPVSAANCDGIIQGGVEFDPRIARRAEL